MAPPTFKVYLPTSVECQWKCSHSVIADPIKFTTKIKHAVSHLPVVIYVIRLTVTLSPCLCQTDLDFTYQELQNIRVEMLAIWIFQRETLNSSL